MIVTIDGPAGVGKSTVARELARRLGFQYLDTGAMYRAVTWLALTSNTELSDLDSLVRLAAEMDFQFDGQNVIVNGRDLTRAIRQPEVTRYVSAIADLPDIREPLVQMQRNIAANGDFVCEGRDQGTVVFPDACCKFFLIASAEERARRRYQQLLNQGTRVDFDTVLAEQIERDHRDSSRPVGALVKAPDAIEVITDGKTQEQVIEELFQAVRQKQKEG